MRNLGYATASDGNKYIQCRLRDMAMRCEAAGAAMQPSLTPCSPASGARLPRPGGGARHRRADRRRDPIILYDVYGYAGAAPLDIKTE
ncbi:MAG TPA: hypothetical protein VN655_09630 [Pseudolabrys sp.]|jgi:hypothetical protein|nr:hypothetical protein [Pseudolabrys sp.]